MILRRLAAVLGLALLSGACASQRAEPPRHVLLVSIDTLRADRLGCYGRAGAGTPVIDALAARGTRFADASSPYPLTLPAHASMLTGQWPMRHGIRRNGVQALGDDAVTLTELLAGRGLRTGAFVGSVVLARRQGLGQGFEAYGEPAITPGGPVFLDYERSARDVNAEALRWIDGLGKDPFFAWIHYMEPHFPYAAPEPERSQHAGDAYQGEVAATDRMLGELLAALESRGLLADTLVIVTADHGEDLGDHEEMTHGLFLYQSTLHVPLVVAGPGVRQGAVVREPVSLVDVAPTVAEAMGAAFPADRVLDGVSLWSSLRDGKKPKGDRELYAETFVTRYEFGWSELRALRSGEEKYVQAPRPELYDLGSDPGERTDLAAREPRRAASLRERLDAAVAAGEVAGAGAGREVELSPEEREALQALGYLQGSGGAAEGGALADPKDHVKDAVALDKGYWLLRHGQPAEARALFEELLAANPLFAEARTALLIVTLTMNDGERAAAIVDEMVRVAEGSGQGAAAASRGHLVYGEWLAGTGRLEEARTQYLAALAAPQPAPVHVTLAKLHAALGDVAAARAVLDALEASGEMTDEGRALRAQLSATGGG